MNIENFIQVEVNASKTGHRKTLAERMTVSKSGFFSFF